MPGAATPQVSIPYRGCRGFRVLGPSQGGQFSLDQNGPIDLIANDSPVFCLRPYLNADGTTAWRYPEVQFTGGTIAPFTVVIDLDESDANPGQPSDYMGGPSPATYQEGDTIPTATVAGAEDMGSLGIPALVRSSVGNTYQILNQIAGNSSGVFVQGDSSDNMLFDSTSAGGAAIDSGALTYSTKCQLLYIEAVASAALTGARTLDIRFVRTDASQFSLFDPIRNAASPISWAASRVNFLAALGNGASGVSSAAAGISNGMDVVWGMNLPGLGTNGIRCNIGAGGAETVRLRIWQHLSSLR